MKKSEILLTVIGSLLTLLGIIFIFSSVHFGTTLAEVWLSELGGADTMEYQIRMKSYTNNFLVSGGILFGIGLCTIVFSIARWAISNDKYITKQEES
ncbi:hypothetical protein KO561_00925 [Radiobacillus kanasensis]|uniref:hypothetical protein n=1 Tax=Radiobacillus kanasensis TaxID=2844358 RepID=UPI001E4D4310|nr:hypothetical protein [Radiobacillus kanasensis]UFT99573.1 hypothetical protein KO561_00925 [Radiobacillus kanasensis]